MQGGGGVLARCGTALGALHTGAVRRRGVLNINTPSLPPSLHPPPAVAGPGASAPAAAAATAPAPAPLRALASSQ